jgi:TonB family protein
VSSAPLDARLAASHTKKATLVAALALASALVAACDKKKRRDDVAPTPDEPSATSSSSASALTSASASASVSVVATAVATSAPSSEPTLDVGPAQASATATRDERQKAVLALLAGGEPLPSLPRVVTEPGDPWDDGLRARLTARKPPQVRAGATTVSGRLPPEVIQRIVRQNFGRFRLCYERGLSNNPSLEGQVVVRFVIGTDGAVSSVTKQSSTLADEAVAACVVAAFRSLSFPQPEGGVVSVSYPIAFKPG